MEPSRICVAWQKRSSPPPSSGRMKPNPLWFQAMQTPVLRGPPSPPNSPLLGAPPASRAPGLRERRGGERERGRGSSLRGGLRSAILLVVCWLAYAVEREARSCQKLSSEWPGCCKRCRREARRAYHKLFGFARNNYLARNTLALFETLEEAQQARGAPAPTNEVSPRIRLRGTPTKSCSHRCRLAARHQSKTRHRAKLRWAARRPRARPTGP